MTIDTWLPAGPQGWSQWCPPVRAWTEDCALVRQLARRCGCDPAAALERLMALPQPMAIVEMPGFRLYWEAQYKLTWRLLAEFSPVERSVTLIRFGRYSPDGSIGEYGQVFEAEYLLPETVTIDCEVHGGGLYCGTPRLLSEEELRQPYPELPFSSEKFFRLGEPIFVLGWREEWPRRGGILPASHPHDEMRLGSALWSQIEAILRDVGKVAKPLGLCDLASPPWV